jgi:hypothetical protein
MNTCRFTPVDKAGKPLPEVGYFPLAVTLGKNENERCLEWALHLGPRGWQISDPKSGACVLVLRAHLKGMPVSSASMTQQEARRAARTQLAVLADDIGIESFWTAIDKARANRVTA